MMSVFQCKCGSYLINVDLTTGNKICSECKSTEIKSLDEYTFIQNVTRKEKRLKNKIKLILDDENDDTNML